MGDSKKLDGMEIWDVDVEIVCDITTTFALVSWENFLQSRIIEWITYFVWIRQRLKFTPTQSFDKQLQSQGWRGVAVSESKICPKGPPWKSLTYSMLL